MTSALELLPRVDWMRRAACRNVANPEIFYTDGHYPSREASKICGDCEVRDECLTHAIEHDERHGIWGGLTDYQRRQLTRRKTRVHCPGCFGTDIMIMDDCEACVACGLTWFA